MEGRIKQPTTAIRRMTSFSQPSRSSSAILVPLTMLHQATHRRLLKTIRLALASLQPLSLMRRVLYPDIDWLQILERRSNDARSKMNARSERLKPIGNILLMIDKAKDGITIATSFQPHAAMAWSCVSFLLPLVSGSLSQNEDAVSGLEYISSLMTRYNLHEKTYDQSLAGGSAGPSSSSSSPGRGQARRQPVPKAHDGSV